MSVAAIHKEVDAATKPLEERHRQRLQCRRGCNECCVDDLTVFQVEAEPIRAFMARLKDQEPGPVGRCSFLGTEGECRIYPVRPYVCRTQGLPLRWLEEDDFEWVEYRDICPLNEAGEPIENLEDEACWSIGPSEQKLADLQMEKHDELKRVALRDLWSEH